MNREEFIRKFNEASNELDINRARSINARSIESNLADGYPRGYKNTIIVMEELSELTQEVAKKLRGNEDNYHITEEIADVLLGILYLQDIYGIKTCDICRAMNVKLDRVENVLNAKGIYQ